MIKNDKRVVEWVQNKIIDKPWERWQKFYQ